MARAAAAAALGAAIATLGTAPPAQADMASLEAACQLRDAADGNTANGPDRLPFFRCDDGIPSAGGAIPNAGGALALEVPAAYQGFAGLPAKDPVAAAAVPGNSAGNVAIDADLSLPDPRVHPPGGGYPLVAFMHGCCSGQKVDWEAETVDGVKSEDWHYNNSWFASRGYAVLTYTARGFVNNQNRGSTGQTQLDHRSFEVNDLQYLAGQIADRSFTVAGQAVTIDPARIVMTGGSYGAGLTWMTLTDPVWRSPGNKELRLAAAAPRYGWSDLAYSLVPNGAHLEGRAPRTDGGDTNQPLGFPKRSVVAALYATGRNQAASHTTFAPEIDSAFACLQSPLPFSANPTCAGVVDQTLPGFVRERSAYYQNGFFAGLADGSIQPVPVYAAGTITDPLFPGREHRRIVERLRASRPGYPLKEYYGDYQHFVQNKRKEWSDLCGADHHVCTPADYPGGDLNADPQSIERRGVNDDLSDFVDHYVKPAANTGQPAPVLNVTASLQVCPANASKEFPLAEPGPRFSAASFEGLAPNTLRIERESPRDTTSKAVPNAHALAADPFTNLLSNGGRCPSGAGPAGAGVASYDSPALPRSYTMIGPTHVTVPYEGTGSELQLNARLYDVAQDGQATMVDRGFRTLTASEGSAAFDLLGNGWRFERGHRVRVELAQDDDPYIKASTAPSRLELAGVTLAIPVREASATLRPDSSDAPETTSPAPSGGGGQAGGRAAAAAARAGSLPFTGLNLGPLCALGLLLAATGLTLRAAVSSNKCP